MMTKTLRAFAVGVVALLAVPAASIAGEDAMEIAVGAGTLLTLDAPFKTVLIGDPEIVDVSRQTDRTAFLKGIGRGASNIVFLDAQDMVIANIRVIVSEARI